VGPNHNKKNTQRPTPYQKKKTQSILKANQCTKGTGRVKQLGTEKESSPLKKGKTGGPESRALVQKNISQKPPKAIGVLKKKEKKT